MKKHYFFVSLLALALSMPRSSFASVQSADSDDGIVVTLGAPKVSMQLMAAQSSVTQSHMVINGTGQSGTFILNAQNLVEDIKLTATSGLEVYPATLPAGSNGETIIITLNSTLPVTEGRIILRSGDARAYVNVTGYGTPLEEKNLSQNPVYPGGDDESFVKGKEDGFTPGENGYTVEFRVKTDNLNKVFEAFAVTPEGAGFKAYVNSTSVGLYDGSTQVNIPNPATAFDGGLQHFYNNDGKYHTYRFSVTSDQRIFVYRDGLQIAILRASDYANQASWTVENGDMVENLLKNPDFEGEYDYRASDSLIVRVEGWQLDPIDQYNCLYTVPNYEINNDLDFNNHVMSLQRYTWNDGWAAGRVSQIVDVAPNETYSLSFLAGGGMKVKDSAIDYLMSSVRIEEVQNSELNNKVEISNMDGMVSYDKNGHIAAILMLFRDITEEKLRELKYQHQLKAAAQQAEKANVAKTDFLRRMSHDIRTPINGIRGMVEICRFYLNDRKKAEECLDKIMAASGFLLELVNDVLDMNKLESGEIVLTKEPFCLSKLLMEVDSVIEMQADESGVDYIKAPLNIENDYLIGSSLHIKQILQNIVSNAVKYNKRGGYVRVSCTENRIDEKNIMFEFVCTDNGQGMSEDFQKKAFEPFAQEKTRVRTTYTGTGLGLAISKKLTVQMGGTIEFISRQGYGTTFYVKIPFEIDDSYESRQQEISADEKIRLDGNKIIIAEDNELNMEIARFIIEGAGAQVMPAVNGEEAVKIFETSQYGEYKVVLMDVMMPVMGGLEAAQNIRKMDRPDAKTVAMIAMSANAFHDDVEQSLAAGMNVHMAKPLDFDKLLATIKEYCDKN